MPNGIIELLNGHRQGFNAVRDFPPAETLSPPPDLQDAQMNRAVMMTLAISSLLLLGGCGPHWEDGERYGRYHDHDHRRGYDQRDDAGQGYGHRYDRRDDDRDYRRYRDRDDRDD